MLKIRKDESQAFIISDANVSHAVSVLYMTSIIHCDQHTQVNIISSPDS